MLQSHLHQLLARFLKARLREGADMLHGRQAVRFAVRHFHLPLVVKLPNLRPQLDAQPQGTHPMVKDTLRAWAVDRAIQCAIGAPGSSLDAQVIINEAKKFEEYLCPSEVKPLEPLPST
jgi:hypothetical protein